MRERSSEGEHRLGGWFIGCLFWEDVWDELKNLENHCKILVGVSWVKKPRTEVYQRGVRSRRRPAVSLQSPPVLRGKRTRTSRLG